MLVFSLFAISCKGKNDNDTPVDIKFSFENFNLTTEGENDYITFDVKAILSKAKDASFKISYQFKETDGFTLLKEEHTNVIDNVFSYKIILTEENYKDNLYLSITFEKETHTVVNTQINIYSLATNLKSETDESFIANRIINKVDEIEISEILLEIDYAKEEAKSKNVAYAINPLFDEEKIKIEITFSSIASLTDDFDKLSVKVNDEKAKGKLIIEDGKYYYLEEKDVIKEISITFDYLKHSDEKETDEYVATYSNPEYNKITITITLKSDYKFHSNFKLILNDEEIKKTNYKIEGNVLTYRFDDPNWSPFY